MGKTKHRKGHDKKVAEYRKKVLDAKKRAQKEMRNFIEQMQHAELEKQVANSQVETGEIEGLNVDDFKLDVEKVEEQSVPQESNVGIVQGVTSPDGMTCVSPTK
jgi:hypothetical protein